MTKKTSKKMDLEPRTIDLNDGSSVIVDAVLFPFLQQFKWKAHRFRKSTYAIMDTLCESSHRRIYMHRLIANTPSGLVCHHRDRNSLNNQRHNLCNMTSGEHSKLHRDDPAAVRYDPDFNFPSTPARTQAHQRPLISGRQSGSCQQF